MMALQLPRILFAIGAAGRLPGELTALAVRRPLLVTDQGLVACGVAGRIRALLPNAAVFDTTPENPVYAGSDAALAAYHAAGCDGVVALGGGSVIDTAKFVAVLACQGGTTAGLAEHTQPITDDVAPLIVLPTTAGTGSETSPDAGIHPAPNTRSRGISTPALIPRVAICDPGLTVTLPPRLTAGTGLDALSHCIEGYLSITDCAPAKAMALDGMRRAWRAVAHATARGEDLTAREEMMLAALAGGVAIGLGLGPAHAIAITCGDQGHHHGVLSALGLVASLDALAPYVPAPMAAIRAALDLPHGASVAEALRARMAELGLPTSLRRLGYQPGDMAELAQAAAASHFNLTSRWRPDAADFAQMIARIA